MRRRTEEEQEKIREIVETKSGEAISKTTKRHRQKSRILQTMIYGICRESSMAYECEVTNCPIRKSCIFS